MASMMQPEVPAAAAEAPPARRADNPGLGIALMIGATLIFACQDAITKMLAQDFAAPQILMVRYLLVLAYAVSYSARRRPLRRCLETKRPVLQLLRSVVIAAEIGIFVVAIRTLSMAEIHSLMATFPLMATALSVPLLGEQVGLRRWSAVAVGFLGVLVILRPGIGVFDWAAVLGLTCAALFALYNVLTRLVSRDDGGDTSLLYMALVRAVIFAIMGPFYWKPPGLVDWVLLVAIAFTSSASHLMLIKALENASASALQPFNYMLLVWATLVGFVVFGHLPDLWTVVGAAIVVASGLYTIYRERRLAKAARRAVDSGAPSRDDSGSG